jgi:hypothetical protein
LNNLKEEQQNANDLLERANDLLEQIRRLQLSPAERPIEDRQRAAEAEREKKMWWRRLWRRLW